MTHFFAFRLWRVLTCLLFGWVGGIMNGCQAAPAPPLDWRARANQDIEKYRKRDVELELAGADGKPLANAVVDVQQTRQAFPFGSAISSRILQNPQWQAQFKSHFNTAVFENESKWTSNQPAQGRPPNYRNADALINWCQANNLAVRGHCLFYEGTGGPPQWLTGLSDADLRSALDNRAVDALAHFKGKFISWDGDNEMLHGTHFFANRLGKDIRVWMYKRARELDPATPLFTNDFNVLSIDKDFQEVETDAYVAQVRDMLAAGAPIDGIGIQGHVWFEKITEHPEVIRERLDKVAAVGLPIWISEFDFANADENLRADTLELVYRTAFSHPGVQGIMMWVFWAGNSWRGPTAALFNQDWTINEEGRRYEALMKEWTTSLQLKTDAQGRVRFRGFLGDYRVTVGTDSTDVVVAPGQGVQRQHLDVAGGAGR